MFQRQPVLVESFSSVATAPDRGSRPGPENVLFGLLNDLVHRH